MKNIFFIVIVIILFVFPGCGVFIKLNPDEWTSDNDSIDDFTFLKYMDITGGNAITDITISNNNKFLYVTDELNNLYLYSINSEQADIDLKSSYRTSAGQSSGINNDCITGTVISPDNKFLYYLNSSSEIIVSEINSENGKIIHEKYNIPVIANTISSIDISLDGTFIAISDCSGNSVNVLKRDSITGNVSNLKTYNVNSPVHCEFSPETRFLYASSIDNVSGGIQLFEINDNSTNLNEIKFYSNVAASAFGIYNTACSPDGRSLYALHGGGVLLISYNIDINSGRLLNYKQIENINLYSGDIKVSQDGKYLYAADVYYFIIYRRDANKCEEVYRFTGNASYGNPMIIAASQDDKIIYSGTDNGNILIFYRK